MTPKNQNGPNKGSKLIIKLLKNKNQCQCTSSQVHGGYNLYFFIEPRYQCLPNFRFSSAISSAGQKNEEAQ